MGCAGSTAVARVDAQKRFHDLYKLGGKLGEGAFGQVRVAQPRTSAGELAVKIVDVRGRDADGAPTKEADRGKVSATRNEIRLWEAVGMHAHCVHLQASFFEKHLFYMVMEKCDCSLMDKLATMSTMTEADLVRMFVEMLSGIQHVHSVGFVHRDIKPDNFLLSGTTVKLCDFGLAVKMPATGQLLTGAQGTAPYMSPEMLEGTGYDHLADVWSFGATAFLMLHGDFPYSPKQLSAAAMKSAILAGRPEIKFVRPPQEQALFRRAFVDRATPFLQALLQRTPSTRRSAAEALRLPFLSLDQRDSRQAAVSAAGAPLAPVARRAREAEQLANPVAQRSLDELLQKLQLRRATSGASSTTSRSESAADDLDRPAGLTPQLSDHRIRRRSDARRNTHSGVLWEAGADCKGLRFLGTEDLRDAASTATPGSSGDGSGRSAGSSPYFGEGCPPANNAPVPA